jgi:hypothetical protein
MIPRDHRLRSCITKSGQEPTIIDPGASPRPTLSAPEPTLLQLGSQSCRVGPHYYTASFLHDKSTIWRVYNDASGKSRRISILYGESSEAHATHMAMTSWTSVGSDAGSPEPIRRPSPATGHEAEILDVYDPYLGYDAEKFPYKPPQRTMRSTSRAGLLGGLCGHIWARR